MAKEQNTFLRRLGFLKSHLLVRAEGKPVYPQVGYGQGLLAEGAPESDACREFRDLQEKPLNVSNEENSFGSDRRRPHGIGKFLNRADSARNSRNGFFNKGFCFGRSIVVEESCAQERRRDQKRKTKEEKELLNSMLLKNQLLLFYSNKSNPIVNKDPLNSMLLKNRFLLFCYNKNNPKETMTY